MLKQVLPKEVWSAGETGAWSWNLSLNAGEGVVTLSEHLLLLGWVLRAIRNWMNHSLEN